MTSDDKVARALPSLALVEKRQGRMPVGGRVGIWFQLFDWHRTFAKKKLFSRKLLPPAHPKQATRSFKGDGKMPLAKLHYIADENEGFPNSRETKNLNVERDHEMGAPHLVARLMGLELMPSVQRRRVINASSRENYNDDKASKFVKTNKGSGRKEMNLEKGQMRREQPQKLPKTGLSERRAVTRFGAEALQIKGVLSRSTKQKPPKLALPVKSPRISSPRSISHNSCLVGAATRILEPGLQDQKREQCALYYPDSMCYVLSDEGITGSSSMKPTHCKNCGYMPNKMNKCQHVEDRRMECALAASSSRMEHAPASSSFSRFRNASCLDSAGKRANPGVHVVDKEKLFSKRTQEEYISRKDGKRLPSDCRPRHLPIKNSAPQRDEPSSVAKLKSRRVPSAATSVSGTKDFVTLNRSLVGQTRPRVLKEAQSYSIDATRRSDSRRDDSMYHVRSPAHRMRTASSDEPNGSTNFCNSTTGKQRKVTSATINGNGKASDKSRVISFISPSKQKVSSSVKPEDRRSSKSCSIRESDDSENFVVEDHLAMRGDALGALLEQKLKELTSQEDDDSTTGSTMPKRSTAMILQELIVALTTDPTLRRNCDMLDTNKAFQAKSGKGGSVTELPCDSNHFSPGSVLNASFSNDSCVSSSLDDNSGLNLLADFVDFSWDLPPLLETNGNLSDSATTRGKFRAHQDIIIYLISCIDRALNELNLAGFRLSRSKLSYAKEVLLHSELLLASTAYPSWFNAENIIISPSLLDELESLVIPAWVNTGCLDGLVDLKEGKQFKVFLFDCLLECLDSKYHPCSYFGYRMWRRLSSRLAEKILVQDVEAGLKMCAALSGMSIDEMIEWEMSHSLGKWLDFDIEAFENGCEIARDILQSMMEEIVDDFLQYS